MTATTESLLQATDSLHDTPSQTLQFQMFTYPQYLLLILAQQVDFQIAFPPFVTLYLVAEHQAREGVL